jgi:hypothetical protein
MDTARDFRFGMSTNADPERIGSLQVSVIIGKKSFAA